GGGEFRVRVALGQLVGPAAVGGQSGVCGDALGAHAEHVEGRGVGERGQQVGAGGAAAPDRLVDHDGGPGQFAGPPGAGVDDAVFDDGGGGAAGVPHQPAAVGDVHEGDAGHGGGRGPGVGHVAVRGVVLQPDHGRAAAQPGVHQGEFVGALQDDDVDVGVPQPFRGHLDDRVGPVEGAGAAEAVGPAVGGDGDDVGVGAL